MIKSLLKKEKKSELISDNPDVAQFQKKRKTRKKRTIIASVVGIALIGWALYPKSTAIPVSTQTLTAGTLTNSLSLTGTVESKNSFRVYADVTATVNEVPVKVGDSVKAGDTLALLDTTDTEMNLAVQKAKMGTGSKSSTISLVAAKKDLDNMKLDMANGTYLPLVTAQQSLDLASKRLSDAKRDYKEHYPDIDLAEGDLNDKEKAMVQARQAKEAEGRLCKQAGQHVNNHTAECTKKQEAYEIARTKWAGAYNEFSDEISAFGKAVQDARLSYENAIKQLEISQTDAERTLEVLTDRVTTSELSADTTIDSLNLKKALMDFDACTVKAPINGKVTAIYASIGSPSAGLMFVVEDTDSLIVKTSIREYDIASVKPELAVLIKSDATLEHEIKGTVARISPTATKSATGDTQAGSSASFPVDINVSDVNSGLLIGMNARMNVILEQKENVFFTPYDSVVTNETGEKIVYVAIKEGSKLIARPKVVTTGMENDFNIEISGETLAEGDVIITNIANIHDGVEILNLNVR